MSLKDERSEKFIRIVLFLDQSYNKKLILCGFKRFDKQMTSLLSSSDVREPFWTP